MALLNLQLCYLAGSISICMFYVENSTCLKDFADERAKNSLFVDSLQLLFYLISFLKNLLHRSCLVITINKFSSLRTNIVDFRY